MTLSPHKSQVNGLARNSDRVIAFRVRVWMSCFCTFWTGHFTRPIFLTNLMYLPLTCQLANDSDVQAGFFHKTSDEESESVKSQLSTELRSGADSSVQKLLKKMPTGCQIMPDSQQFQNFLFRKAFPPQKKEQERRLIWYRFSSSLQLCAKSQRAQHIICNIQTTFLNPAHRLIVHTEPLRHSSH